MTSAGNQRHYQANRAAPIFEELRGIVLKTFGLSDTVRKALVIAFPKLRAAFIYGSLAKDTAGATSDVDLMIIDDAVSYADAYSALERPAEQRRRAINPTVYTTQEISSSD